MLNSILVVAFSFFPATETDSIRMETIGGKMYIIHRVEQKETLFSISRKYGVALVVMVENNPNAGSGLEVGALVKVPYTPNKTVKTKDGIVHKVGDRETLYSISKQYGVTVDELKSWNTIPSSGIKMGQELLIKEKAIVKVPETLTEKTIDKVVDKVPESKAVNRHTVAPSETMYAISRMYGVTIQQLKDWNKLTSTDLKPGQVIIIAALSATAPLVEPTTPKTELIPLLDPTITPSEVKTTMTEKIPTSNPNVIPITQSVTGSDEIHENGMAVILDGTEGNRKYFAHHRSAKPDTILRVKNNLSQKQVFVRVVENLPNSEASDVVIRISKSAFDKLGGEGKFQVEVIYFK